MQSKMKGFFAVLIFYHLFVSTSMASSARGWVKSTGDDIGANRTKTYQELYSVTGSRRLLTQYPTDNCYKQFFVGGQAPTGFRPPHSGDIRYICQQIEEFSDETLYVTMFDERIGIAVYAGYGLLRTSAQQIGIFPRIQKWTTDKDIHRQGTNNAYAGNLVNIQKGHLVPASTYSFDCISMVSTFRYTNAVPQYAAFNMGPWKDYEDKVREFARDGCSSITNGDLYLLTGTSEAVLTPAGAVSHNLGFFPQNNPNNGANIAIPNSMWTAGCCILPEGGAFGGFAAIGNNVQVNPEMHQVTVKDLENILAIGTGTGVAIKLFPGNDGCSEPLNQFKYDHGQWTKVKKFP